MTDFDAAFILGALGLVALIINGVAVVLLARALFWDWRHHRRQGRRGGYLYLVDDRQKDAA